METNVKQLICTDLVVDKQIKDTFRIYYQQFGAAYIDYFGVHHILHNAYGKRDKNASKIMKWNYIYTVQKSRIKEAGIPASINTFHALLNNVRILLPKRYQPEDVEMDNIILKENINIMYRALVFKEQSISYLMQKYISGHTLLGSEKYGYPITITLGMMINFFKSVCEHTEGIEFEEYIDNWAKRLVEDTR